MFLDHKIKKPKTEVMAAENLALPLRINYVLKYAY